MKTDRVQRAMEGVVGRIVFEGDAGWRVVRVTVGGEEQTWVGICPPIAPGQQVRAVGSYEDDAKYGRRFKVDSLVAMLPSTAEGLMKFLGSGSFSGIGPALAKRIVTKFGEDTLRVLSEQPERLTEVKGIGKKAAAALTEEWTEQRAVAEIMVFLQQHGASPALAMRIFRRFGAESTEVIRTDPYRLAVEVDGVGFATADRIALAAGISADDPARARAAVMHVLSEATRQGHCYCLGHDLGRAVAELTGRPTDVAADAVAAICTQSRLVHTEDVGGAVAVFPRRIADAEMAVAGRICDLLYTASPHGASLAAVAPSAIETFQAQHFSLASGQRDAIQLAAASKVSVITGGPGTGKTTVLRALLAILDAAELPVRLAAPTGRAAKRMAEATGREAQTIHRLLEYSPQVNGFTRNARNPIDASVVVIDESSMVDIRLASDLLDAIPNRARLVLVGDVDQLPSVGPGSVLRDVIASGIVPTARLTHIFRQAAGSEISEAASRINAGEAPETSDHALGEFHVIERDGQAAAEIVVDLVAHEIPERFGIQSRDIQVITPMHKGDTGTMALNAALQAAVNPTGEEMRRGGRVYRVGDRVMQLRNDYNRDVFNGDLGVIESIAPEDRTLTATMNGRSVPYASGDMEHLTLAYAASVHKLQGAEAAAVVVVMNTSHYVMLSRNLLYTAVTRGKRLVYLVTTRRAVSAALAETRREDRRTRLRHRLTSMFEGSP